MKSTDFLMQEHKVILRTLDVLDAIVDSIDVTRKADQSDIDNILDLLRWFADAHHQAKEETILFPALKQAAANQDRSLEHLNLEHDQERSLVEDLEADLRLAKLPEFVARGQRLSSTLRNHIYKEDRILFETVDAVLTAEQDDAVVERLQSFDTELDKQALNEKLKHLHTLEWKYLRR
jgi:hemerythrin-like domain-containing protein